MGVLSLIGKATGALGSAFSPISTALQVGSTLFGGLRQNRTNMQQATNQMSFQESANAKQMAFQKAANAKQMAFQTAANRKAMAFSERMSNTAHRRQMRDLRKAGLNPILSAKYGGASAPGGVTSGGATSSGATSAGAKASVSNIGAASAQSFLNAQKTAAQIQLINAQQVTEQNRPAYLDAQTLTENQKQNLYYNQADVAYHDARAKFASIAKIKAETLLAMERTKETAKRIKLLVEQAGFTYQQATRLEKLMPVADLDGRMATRAYAEILRAMERLNVGPGAVGLLKNLLSKGKL